MSERPYHHGDLRSALLTEAERTLREEGLEALSLRELARQTGVSHAAPRRHFPDRQALLDALAEAGFLRLAGEARAAIAGAGPDPVGRLRAVARTYVRFAGDDAALLDLMFTTKVAHRADAVERAAYELFDALGEPVDDAQRDGALPPGDPARLRLVLGAILQGAATLLSSGRVDRATADTLVDDAVALVTGASRK